MERIKCVGCSGAGGVSGQAVDRKTAVALGWKKRADGWICDTCQSEDALLRQTKSKAR